MKRFHRQHIMERELSGGNGPKPLRNMKVVYISVSVGAFSAQRTENGVESCEDVSSQTVHERELMVL